MRVKTPTKADFWDYVESRFPFESNVFYAWVDRYKADHNWSMLFNETSDTAAPKFHELPFAMQKGIFEQYLYESGGHSGDVLYNNFVTLVVNTFSSMQKQNAKLIQKP